VSASAWGERPHATPRGGTPATRGALAIILDGFRIQIRVVHALLLRELQTRFGRNQFGFLWLFLEPLLLAAAIATLKWALDLGHTIPGVPIFIFALVSYLPYFTFRAIVSRAPGTLRSNMTLLYHSQIRLLDIVIARHLLEMAAVITVMTAIAFGIAFFADMLPNNVPALMGGLLLLFLLANGLGLMAAAAAAVSEIAERLIHPLIYMTLPISGVLLPLAVMDPGIRAFLLWNPLVSINEMVREGFFGDLIPTYFSVPYVLLCVGITNLLGLAALRVVRPRLEF
jgi:capsular polysaccharide transport system permease protein